MTDNTFPRRVPAIISYIEPFRIIESDDFKWECTIDEINLASWDYVRLHEIAGGIDVGLETPYHLVVSRDGGLALPPIPELRHDQEVVEFFNRCLAYLLLGGIFCRSITLDNLQFGSIIDWKYLRAYTPAHAGSNQFHDRIRMKKSTPIESISLYKPRTIKFSSIENAMKIGRSAFSKVPELSGEFLLKGVTGYARRDWGTALSNLWIVVEQLTQNLWNRHVIEPEKQGEGRIVGRRDQLSDFRTWTMSARHELLTQLKIFPKELLAQLSIARRARNDLSHQGKHPDENASKAAYSSVCELLKLATEKETLPLFSMALNDHSISDPFQPKEQNPLNPEYWMEIPKLPGERELEIEEAKSRAEAGEHVK